MRRLLLPWIILLLPASAQTTILRHVADAASDTHVEVSSPLSEPPPTGWFPVRVKIANPLPRTQEVKLDFSSGSGWMGGNERSSCAFTIAAKPREVVIRDLLVPIHPARNASAASYGEMLTVKLEGSLGEESGNVSRSSPGDEPAVLMSAPLMRTDGTALSAALHERKKAKGGWTGFSASQPIGASFDPKDAPTAWQAYSGFDTIAMGDADWTALAPSARNAILAWLRLGGRLVVHAPQGTDPAGLGLPVDSAGFGRCELSPKLDPEATLDLWLKNLPGSISRRQSLAGEYVGSWPLQARFGTKAFDYGIFIAVLLAFGILVGPVNLFVFAKSGRRHRLFITTPLIALVTSAVLVALIIFQDGFGGDGIRRVLMEVRPEGGGNTAYVHQEQFSRTGLIGGSRFTVDPVCDFAPVPIAPSRWARFTPAASRSSTFDLQADAATMRATGDWWQSRSEHGHVLRAVCPTRGRIERATGGGHVSSFEFPIEWILVNEGGDTWLLAEGVIPGKPFTATPVDDRTAVARFLPEAEAFGVKHQTLFRQATLRAGHFIALTGSAPAIATHPGIRWRETRTVITGPIQ